MIPYSIVGSYMVSLTWLKFVSFASEPRLHFTDGIRYLGDGGGAMTCGKIYEYLARYGTRAIDTHTTVLEPKRYSRY